MTARPTVPLKTFARYWWVCPSCATENGVTQRPCSEDDMREATGIEPWTGEPVPEGFTLATRGRCFKCELVVDIDTKDMEAP